MAAPWFIREDYLHSKLAQLIASGDTSYSNIMEVDAAIKAAGFTAYTHFLEYGSWERTSPNQYFDAHKYLDAKAAQMNGLPGSSGDWNADKVALAIEDARLSIWEHFQKYGWLEGVQPSTSFDVVYYMDQKLAKLQAAEPSAGWTAESLRDVFTQYGLSPVSHYYMYGRSEGQTPLPVPDPPAPDPSGRTYTLIVGEDDITGTALNDTFNAPVVKFAGEDTSTLETIDFLDGGAGLDTLNATLMGGTTGTPTTATPNLNRIEIFNLRVPIGEATLGFANVDGVEQVWNSHSSKGTTLTYDGANIDTIFGVRNTTATTVINLANTPGVSDVLNVMLSNAGEASTAAQAKLGSNARKVKNLSIEASGINYVAFDIADTQLTDITVTGSGSINVADALLPGYSSFSKVQTVDAIGFKGDFTIDLSGSAALESVETGVGDDDVAVDGTRLKADATLAIDLGQGDNLLRLVGIGDSNALNSLTFQGNDLTLAGVTSLAFIDSITGGAATLDLAGIDPKVIAFGGVAAFAGSGLKLENTGKELGMGFNMLVGTVDFGDTAETVTVVAGGMIGTLDPTSGKFEDAEAVLSEIQDALQDLDDDSLDNFDELSTAFPSLGVTVAEFKGEALTSFKMQAEDIAIFHIAGAETKLNEVKLVASGEQSLIIGFISDDDTSSNTPSIETLTLADSSGGAIIASVLLDTSALTTINISPGNASWFVVDAWMADFGSAVTINIGTNADNSAGPMLFSYQADDDVTSVSETFKYAKTNDIGVTVIADFEAGNSANHDRIDFSQFDNVNRMEDLNVVKDTCGCSDSVLITAANGQFDGSIELVYLNGVLGAENFIFN